MLNKNSHQRNTENKGSDSLDIRKKTNSLKKRYGTNDPFDIAKYLGIKVIAELEQGGDKPLFYAVLGVCVDVSVFKGGKPDSPAVMPQNFFHGFRLAAGRPDNGFIRNEFRISHAKAPPFLPATSARHCGYNAMPYFYNTRINPRFPAVCNSRKNKGK